MERTFVSSSSASVSGAGRVGRIRFFACGYASRDWRDIPLSLCQSITLSGAIIVTTPQNVALEDVNRGISMFNKVEVDILGVIENMSYYDCPKCSKRHYVFGDGGASSYVKNSD